MPNSFNKTKSDYEWAQTVKTHLQIENNPNFEYGEKVISPIDKKLILQELNADTFVRKTNFANHEITLSITLILQIPF